MNRLNKILLHGLLLVFSTTLLYAQGNYQYIEHQDIGNPGGLNVEPDDLIAGWQPITQGGEPSNMWSASQPLPFSFLFYNNPVQSFQVSANGLLTFDGLFNSQLGTSIQFPPNDNSALPASNIPDATIACYWDDFTNAPPLGPDNIIYTKVFGQAPNRQLWVKWQHMAMGNPVAPFNYFACVLEESSNKIYLVNMNHSAMPNYINATVGLQANAALHHFIGYCSFGLDGPSPGNNHYVEIVPDPALPCDTDFDLGHWELVAGSPRFYCLEEICPISHEIKQLDISLSLDLGEDYELGDTHFNTDVTCQLMGYNELGVPTGYTETVTLSLEHNPSSRLQPEQVYFKRLTGPLAQVTKRVELQVNHYHQDPNHDVQNAIRLQLQLDPVLGLDVRGSSPFATTSNVDLGTYPTTFNWTSTCDNIQNYEVQILRLYNENIVRPLAELQSTVDWSKALSVLTESPDLSLQLHVQEGTGYYLWRVRPIGTYFDGGFGNDLNWGAWSDYGGHETGTTVTHTDLAGQPYAFFFTQPDADKNWIFTRVFTEGNQLKESMTFANGLGQSKQTQVKLQEQDQLMAHQQVYDFSGRAALQSLPAPVDTAHLTYQPLFLQYNGNLYTAQQFDNDANATQALPINGGLLHNYYSTSNPDPNIPDAEGYAFSRTLFYPQEQRVQKQSGLGKVLRLQNDASQEKVSRFFYAKVPDQELVKLFGHEAPAAASVYQVVNIDANGTASVQFINHEGEKIVTCLANAGLNDDLLSPLDSRAATQVTNIQVVPNIQATYDEIQASAGIIILGAPNLELNYEITPKTIEAACGEFCFQCDYDITLEVVQVSTNQSVFSHSIVVPGAACSEASPVPAFSTTLSLPDMGAYRISKSIKLATQNPLTGKQYIEEHKTALETAFRSQLQPELDDLMAYLDAGDLEGFYEHLEVDVDTMELDDWIPLNLGCANISIPVEKCDTPACPDGVDFEQALYDHYNGTIDPHAYSFFSTDGHPTFPSSTASFQVTGVSSDAFRQISICELWPTTGGSWRCSSRDFALVDLPTGVSFSTVQVARLIAEAINNNPDNKHLCWATFDKDAYVYIHKFDQASMSVILNIGGTTSGITTTGLSTVTRLSFTASPYTYGDGAFNALIDNMIADGYHCGFLYQTWLGLIEAQEWAGFNKKGSTTIPNRDYDLLATFLAAVGTNYSAISGTPYGSNGYLENAHKVFHYQPRLLCDTLLGFDPSNIWPASDKEKWAQLKGCTSTGQQLYNLDDLVADCDGLSPVDCAIATAASMEDSCEQRCWQHFPGFLSELEAQYLAAGLNISNPIHKSCLIRQAWALVDACQQDCDLTVFSSGGYIDSVGSSIQLERISKVYSHTYDIQLTAGACLPDYKFVPTPAMSFLDLLIQLNWALDRRTQRDSCVEWTGKQLHDLVGEFFGSDLLPASSYANDLTTYQVKCDAVLSNSEYVLIGSNLYFRTYDMTGSMVTNLRLFSDFSLYTSTACNDACFKWVPIESDTANIVFYFTSCQEDKAKDIKGHILAEIERNLNEHLMELELSYWTTCTQKDSLVDDYQANYQAGYYHYTLFYYDRAGRLIETVPPKGVDESFWPNARRDTSPDHAYKTQYAYNSLGQQIRRTTPDGGLTTSYYDDIGRIRFTQNAQQKLEGTYSYIKYDALSRPTETGESNEDISNINTAHRLNDGSNFPNIGTEKKYTVYTKKDPSIKYQGQAQSYLQNRVSYTYTDQQDTTWFSYDAHGNMNWMIRKIDGLGKKSLAYEYDLISQKVTQISYNKGFSDQFFHRYAYDSDQRVISLETSKDAVIWDQDASYEYYLHGPLKRQQLGEDQIQGLDYVYTLQGWLKSINHSSKTISNDPGMDGATGSKVPQDAFGMTLAYYKNDFKQTGSPFNSHVGQDTNSLYNGLITGMEFHTANPSAGSLAFSGQNAQLFKYDELGRLLNSHFHHFSAGSWTATEAFRSSYAYDANGNLTSLNRKNDAAVQMDQLTYSYNSTKNQLNHITDASGYAGSGSEDLKTQSTNNYEYNAIGELTKDVHENIANITWTSTGKVKEVTKTDGSKLEFVYDASDNRVRKTVTPPSGPSTTYYYVKNAGMQNLAVYKAATTGTTLKELTIGATGQRLGLYQTNASITPLPIGSTIFSRYLEDKQYELKDHLGNVRVSIEDKKLPISGGGGPAFEVAVSSVNSYYPYGSLMPNMTANSPSYRYGFQGMEKDDEWHGKDGTSYTTHFRSYDPRVGRWLSLDPKADMFPSSSPYVAFNNNPLYFTDPLGDAPENVGNNKGRKTVNAPSGNEQLEVTEFEATAGTWVSASGESVGMGNQHKREDAFGAYTPGQTTYLDDQLQPMTNPDELEIGETFYVVHSRTATSKPVPPPSKPAPKTPPGALFSRCFVANPSNIQPSLSKSSASAVHGPVVSQSLNSIAPILTTDHMDGTKVTWKISPKYRSNGDNVYCVLNRNIPASSSASPYSSGQDFDASGNPQSFSKANVYFRFRYGSWDAVNNRRSWRYIYNKMPFLKVSWANLQANPEDIFPQMTARQHLNSNPGLQQSDPRRYWKLQSETQPCPGRCLLYR